MTASHDASSLDPTVVSTTSFLHQPTVVTSSVSSLSHHAVASTVVSPTLPSVVRQRSHVPVFKDPPLTFTPRERILPHEDFGAVQAVVVLLIEKEAVVRLPSPPTTPGFYADIFTVAKRIPQETIDSQHDVPQSSLPTATSEVSPCQRGSAAACHTTTRLPGVV